MYFFIYKFAIVNQIRSGDLLFQILRATIFFIIYIFTVVDGFSCFYIKWAAIYNPGPFSMYKVQLSSDCHPTYC